MDKYVQMKRFHYERQLQVYTYAFMYFDHEKTKEKYYFPSTIVFEDYKKISTTGQFPKNWLFVFQQKNSACVFYSFSSTFYLVGDKTAADCFKDEIKPFLKAKKMLELSQNVAMNHVREKGKPGCKIPYEVFK